MINGFEINGAEINGSGSLRSFFASHSSPWDNPIVGSHRAPWPYGAKSDHRAPYSVPAPRQGSHSAPFTLAAYNGLEGSVDIVVTFGLGGAVDLGCVLLSARQSNHSAPFQVAAYDIVAGSADLAAGFSVGGMVAIVYGLQQGLTGAADLDCPLRTTVTGAVDLVYTLGNTPLYGSNTIIYNLVDNALLIGTGTVTLSHAGQGVEIGDAVTLEINEGEHFWRGSVDMKEASDIARFTHGDLVTLNFYGEAFTLAVDRLVTDRTSPAGVRTSLELVSPSCFLGKPPATRLTKTWDVPVSARAAVEELIGAVEWRIMDWTIPGNRLGADNAYPMDVARRIAEAIGAVIECYPDGSLYVRYRHETPVGSYPTATPDHALSESENLFALSDNNQYADIADQFRISDIEGPGFADRLEFVADEDSNLRGQIHVYPSPWRPVRLVHTGPGGISLIPMGETTLTKTEQIEILDGKGSLGYPIHAITGVQWEATNLGGLSFEQGSTSVVSAIPRETLCTVTYQTRAVVYSTSSPMADEVQYVLYED